MNSPNDLPAEELGGLLRWGVILATLTVVLGGALFLHAHGAAGRASFQAFHGEPAPLKSLAGIFHSVIAGDARAIIQLGIVLLVATPVARVLFAIVAFLRTKDWLYVAISAVVAALLFWSLLRG